MATTAFVTIVADTSRTDDQLQRDLDRIIRDVQRQLPDIDVAVRVDPGSLNGFTGDMGRVSDGADRAGISLASLGRFALSSVTSLVRLTAVSGVAAAGLGGITAAAGGAVAALGGLEGITNQAAGSLAVLAAARGVLTIALSGVSDVIGTLTGTTEEFEAALEALSPEAQAVAREFRAVSPVITTFRDTLQDALFAQLSGEGVARRFAGTLNAIRPAAAGVATEFGKLFLTLAKAVTTPEAIGQINTVLRKTDDLIRAITPKAEAFVKGFLERAADGTTQFSQTFETLKTVFDAVSGVMQDVGRIFGAIGDAAEATGGSIGGPLAAALDLVADLFESPAGGEFLRTLMELGQTILGTLAPVLGTLLGALAPIIRIIADALIPILDTLQEPLQILITALGDALVPIFEALGPVAQVLAEAVGDIVVAFAPLLPVIGKLIAGILPIFIPQIQQLGRLISALLPVVIQLIDTALTPMLPVIQELGTLWAEWTVPLVEIVEQVGPPLVDLMVELTPLIELVAKSMVESIRQSKDLLEIFTDLASFMGGVLAGAIELVVGLFNVDYAGAMRSVQQITSTAVNAVVRFFTSLPGRTASALGSLGSTLARIARDAGTRLASGILGKINDTVTFVRRLPGRARDALGNLGNTLYSSGRSLISGFISGILSRLGDVKNAAGSIVSAARDFFPFSPAREGPFSGQGYTTYSGQALMDDWLAGIRSRASDVARSLADVMAGTQPQFQLAGAQLAGAGLTMGPTQVAAPSVAVFIGNEQLHGYIDARVATDRRATERMTAQGVRR